MMVVFEKQAPIRHIGHLDLMRTMQRALRRSGVPLQYSKGFSPHIQLSFASPLSVGVVGLGEIMDVPLGTIIAEQDMVERLNSTLPMCLHVRKARILEDSFPTLMALVAGSRYELQLDETPEAVTLCKKLSSFMELSSYMALRKTKSGENMTNIRPFILEAKACEEEVGNRIHCVLHHSSVGTLKPSLLMKALCEYAQVPKVSYLAIRHAILCQQNKMFLNLEDYANGF